MVMYVNGEKVEEHVIQQELYMLMERYAEHMSESELEEKQPEIEKDARENAAERLLLMQTARTEVGDISDKRIDRRLQTLIKEAGGRDALFEQIGCSPDEEDKIREDLKAQIQYEDYLESVTRDVPKPSEEECRQFYDDNPEEFHVPATMRLSAIIQHPNPQRDPMLVYTDLMNVRQQIMGGADFADMANHFSESHEEGGDLGYVTLGDGSPFDEAIAELKVGEVSDVITSEFGYYLIKITDRAEEHVQPFEESSKHIAQEIQYEKKNLRIGEVVDALRAKADIKEVEEDTEA